MKNVKTARPMAALVTTVAAALLVVAPIAAGPAEAAAKTYKNCDAMHRDYPHGVGKPGARDKTSGKPVTNFKVSTALYNANTKSDRDKDKIACEKR
ncbi:excalibur calcium-binding domain-containing protein [Nocardioides plantarum]|uniref:Excalibur calcium-binding domain-containing protein n=1 Tax=Nocardioides plantarum TaxID=29299 RepID=A0ABV5KEK3_9ACTN|nr:excalibur calcium-binding domain-containing protein [Nocardioides plantarum]